MTKALTRRNDGIEEKLPSNKEVEHEIVSAFFYEHKDSRFIFDMLNPEDFYDVQYQRIFETAAKLFKHGKPFDLLAVADAMDPKQLADMGGLEELAKIPMGMFSAFDVEYACRALLGKSQQRAFIRTAKKILDDAW